MTPSLSSNGAHLVSLAETAHTASPAERCTTGCTESLDRVEILARAVELVAAMKLPLEEAAVVLERLMSQRSST
jgi:hypothetical protein